MGRRSILWSMGVLAFMGSPVWADATSDFASGQADAIRVAVSQVTGDRLVPVRADDTFHQGDRLRVSLESNFGGFVYVINQQPGGKVVVLLPDKAHPDGVLVAHQTRDFPTAPESMVFDSERGIESLEVVIAHDKVPVYEQAIHNGGLLTAADPYASDSGRAQVEKGGVVLAKRKNNTETASRGLSISTPHDEVSTYVSVTPRAAALTTTHLQSNEAGVFEIHLKHE